MKFRKLRVQDVLREEISLIIQRDLKHPGIGLTTILEVKMTDDLKTAKVYCSIFGSGEERAKTMEALNRSKGYIRHLLSERMKLRYTPELILVLDTTQDRVDRIEEILKGTTGVRED